MIIHCKETKLVPINDLKYHPKNRNSHPKEQIERLAQILKYQGWRYPVKVSNLSGYVTSGHGRIEAAKLLNWFEVPVSYQDYISEEQEYSDIVADNAIAFWSELDLSGINTDIVDLGPEFNIDLLGIKDFEIEIADKFQSDPDEIPEIVESKTKSGDIYKLGNHRLMCGDSSQLDQVDKLMDGQKAKMCFSDPPYGVSYQKKTIMLNSLQPPFGRLETPIHGDDFSLDELKEILSEAFKNIYLSLDEKSSYYITAPQGGELGLMMMMMMQESGIPCRHMLVWVKNNATFSMNKLDYDYRHEPILYGWSKDKTHEFYGNGEFKNSVWEIDRENNKLHPTMKPIAIIENCILNSTKQNELVIDLFGGSGSTMIASEKNNRICFMMEIDPHYCSIIIERWCKYTGQEAYLVNEDGSETPWSQVKTQGGR